MEKQLQINDINLIDEVIYLTGKEAETIYGGGEVMVYGPPGIADKAGTGFALERPGLSKKIPTTPGGAPGGFTGSNAGNGANSGGAGNNGWKQVTFGRSS